MRITQVAGAELPGGPELLVPEVLVGLATDTTVYLSRRGEALKVSKLTFTIRASDSSWHPGLPGRPLFPKSGALTQVAGAELPGGPELLLFFITLKPRVE